MYIYININICIYICVYVCIYIRLCIYTHMNTHDSIPAACTMQLQYNEHTATHCNTLQHTPAHSSTLHLTATDLVYYIIQHRATGRRGIWRLVGLTRHDCYIWLFLRNLS